MSSAAMPREPRSTLLRIFAIENRWLRLAEVCNHIIAKIDRRGAGCLTGVERTIDRVNDFEYRMIRGGLSAFLYADWLDWKAIAEIANALQAVGAVEASRLLHELVALVATAVEKQPALSERDNLAWADMLALVDPARELERIELDMAPHIDGLTSHLLAYVEAHQIDLLRADDVLG